MSEVYELAERLKSRHGGAAVVLGALSPRTRNAQVAMYQAGEVQHLVATDAIGMGLNLDVDHVAFASLVKFDGRERRPLAAHEVAQIAGRAGRHSRDGSFGVTAGEADLDPEIVRAVEHHVFPDVRRVVWRNVALDFRTVDRLVETLARTPPRGFMDLVRSAYDTDALVALAADPVVRARARGEADVRLLWEVCQIPDYRKTLTDSHTILLKQIHERLSVGLLPTDWIALHLQELDRPRADIETLMARIAAVRTWSYVAFRADWVSEPEELQARARAIEDRLSDALHDALTARFVDRKGLVLVRPRLPEAATRQAGAGGLSFGQALVQSVGGSLVEPIVLPTQVERILAAPDGDFALGPDGAIRFEGARVARLRAGRTPATPTLALGSGDPSTRKAVHARLDAFARQWLDRSLGGLAIESDDAGVRGLSHALVQGLGSVVADEFVAVLGSLRPRDRKALARAGIRLGREIVVLERHAVARERRSARDPHRGPFRRGRDRLPGGGCAARGRDRRHEPRPVPTPRVRTRRSVGAPPRRVRVGPGAPAARPIRPRAGSSRRSRERSAGDRPRLGWPPPRARPLRCTAPETCDSSGMKRLSLSLCLAALSSPAVAGKWAGKNADVVATRVVPVESPVLFERLLDVETFRAMLPADCASDWDLGEPRKGIGAHGSVRYDIGGMHRHLDFVLNKADAPRQIDLDHMGRRGFVTRLALRPVEAGTELELHTYLEPPRWPFTSYFFTKVHPAWVDCYERALQNVAATTP